MSEEIIKALIQLFAIITKQDGGVTEEERNYVISFFQMELDRESVKKYVKVYDDAVGYDTENPEFLETPGKQRATVEDSVKALQISKRINKTLSQKQKIIVLLRLLELLKADNQLTPIGLEIIDVIATIFNITPKEYGLMKSYVVTDDAFELEDDRFLIITNEDRIPKKKNQKSKAKISAIEMDGVITVLKLDSVNMYFLKYQGEEEVFMNSFTILPKFIHIFTPGSTLKAAQGYSTFYSDIAKFFDKEETEDEVSFEAKGLEYIFSSGDVGLHKVDIEEEEGTLVGIMGASGSGKTTLLNVISGILTPSKGVVKVNEINIHKDKKRVEGVLGYVSQDDLLMSELTVFQNLYYNAKLCLAHLSEKEILKKIDETLENLGLEQTKDIKVGSALNKTISGGQRKRLNIALELIREPAVLFVDEPTSGLSSRDSENVMDLLKELTLRGKLVFVVIHQPSSDIYKMFDRMIVMDTGGYMIYYGHPVETLTYFKEATHQLDKVQSICPTCGNVNPEQIFNIIEARVVNEFGEFTNKRKVTPKEWNEIFEDKAVIPTVNKISKNPPVSLSRPSMLMQARLFSARDFLSKISDRQYMLISLISSPILAFVLSFVIRYRSSPTGEEYIFRYNENIPAFFLVSIIVALLVGLSVSAEEIIRDQRILKRERFLNLSWLSYLLSKTGILFLFSAIQTLAFVLIGNSILELKGMTFMFWLILFSCACAANLLGLSISSAFKSAVTVYILIPIILIPQMIFSGLLFSFEKLHPSIADETDVPILADMMISRWALEAMAVYQFKENNYENSIFEYDQAEHQAEFKTGYWMPEIRKKVNFVTNNFYKEDEATREEVNNALELIRNEFQKLEIQPEEGSIQVEELTIENINPNSLLQISRYLNELTKVYNDVAIEAIRKRERLIYLFENDERYNYDQSEMLNKYYNRSVADLVRNSNAKNRIKEYKNELIQLYDLVFLPPDDPNHAFNYRTHNYSPWKYLFGVKVSTHAFNIVIIWMFSLFFFVTLYFNLPSKTVKLFERR